VRVLIDPEKLALTEAGDENSGKNILAGNVVQTTDEKNKIRVVVDLGIWMTLLMPRDTYNKRRPLIGERVGVAIPPESVRILE
jgi:tungstate transport system ATP-binding protein